MFIASYPASFWPEKPKGFHVRFLDFPDALTGGSILLRSWRYTSRCGNAVCPIPTLPSA
jgi:hypothetical protein